MKKFSVLLGVLCAFSAMASSDIINGQKARPGQFPFIVKMTGCTATKVGPRHFLIAAHCLYLGPGTFNPPPRMTIRAQEILEPTTLSLARVVRAPVHPTWLEACRNRCTGHETGGPRDKPGRADIAMVEIDRDSPEIPIAPVLYTSVPLGTEVTLAGYGCTRGINSGGNGDLTYGTTRLGGPELLRHPGSLYLPIAAVTAQSFLITPGTSLDPTAPALCPGDSGGPLLVQVGGKWNLIGIASDYTFTGYYEASGAIPMTNLHTRVDDQSLHKIGEWIRANLAL
ncbi:MAG: S1 family peptidase [Bdellovibrionales bacterium]|nr:S1 family peptidase [Bdellovibrionales bacterium]